MMSSLWVSKTGLSAQDTALRTISNNLANVATVGFKRDRAMFQDLLYQIQQQPGGQSTQDTTLPSGLQLGTGVRVAGTQKTFSEGSLQTTDAPLDMAIEGHGFFQILMPDGTTAYTRDGEFHLDQNGQIVTTQGFALEPSITIPPDAQTVTIGSDGIVTAMTRGATTATQLGTIELANFVNPAGLQAMGNNLFVETPASGSPQTAPPGQDGLGTVAQGSLENSNVSVVEELVNMVAVQRAYEMNSRVVSTSDQMLQYLTQNV